MSSKAEREKARADRLAAKEAKKEAKRYRSGRRRLANVSVLFEDHTYISQVVDIEKIKTVTIDGLKYEIPRAPYRHVGPWPHKARSFKRALFGDDYFNVDFRAGDPKAINVSDEDEANGSYWTPRNWLGALDENLYRDSLRSQAKMDRNGLFDNKAFVLMVFTIIGVGGLIAAYMFGMI